MSSNNTSNCGQTPRVVRIFFIWPNRSTLRYDPSPLVGIIKPVTIEIVVVLPAPLCPSKAKISPSNILTLMLFTAVNLPNSFLKFDILSNLPSASSALYFSPNSSSVSLYSASFATFLSIST